MFPFASHFEYGYSLDFADDLLKKIGKYAISNSIRLTMHPGQYDVLSSANDIIIRNTINDLNVHADILNRMNIRYRNNNIFGLPLLRRHVFHR